jgi:hypothetical protein
MTDFTPYPPDLFGDANNGLKNNPLALRFIIPPFSDLSARSKDWQNRKNEWSKLGIKSEMGRKDQLLGGSTRAGYAALEKIDGCKRGDNGTSVFDPVLCEVIYSWFSFYGCQIVDPFCGGSVRGIIAALMGRYYYGVDLRDEQIKANEMQAQQLCNKVKPVYSVGDSFDKINEAPYADFIFSCPPYGDLEKYSDDPNDLSNMEWHTFSARYKHIIKKTCDKLKDNRFACFVVGNFRSKKGFIRDLVGETIKGFEACGVNYYNEGILLTALGNAGMRATKQFNGGRKLVKTHQNILVFCKGDPKKAAMKIVTDKKSEQPTKEQE